VNWRNLFKSSHTLWLETQVAELRKSHLEELGRMKSAYAEEIKRVIQDNQKLRDDLDRTRLLLTPALQSVTLKHEQDSSPPPSPNLETPTGTPWQRFLKSEIARQEAEATTRKNYVKPAEAPVEGANNGDAGQSGRVAPLSE
jgi:hypothetical protein